MIAFKYLMILKQKATQYSRTHSQLRIIKGNWGKTWHRYQIILFLEPVYSLDYEYIHLMSSHTLVLQLKLSKIGPRAFRERAKQKFTLFLNLWAFILYIHSTLFDISYIMGVVLDMELQPSEICFFFFGKRAHCLCGKTDVQKNNNSNTTSTNKHI